MKIPQIPGGVARHKDLVALMGKRPLRAALDQGILMQPWRGVVIRADAALDLRTRAAAAVMVAGEHAVLSGPTAVALHGYTAAESQTVHVTVPYTRSIKSRSGLVVHQKRFTTEDVVRIDGLPVLAHDLALAEFLCDGDTRTAFACLDQALHGLDPKAVDAVKATVRDRLDMRDDPRGVAKALALAELATGKADSPPESWIRLIVVEAGLPIPEPQYEIRSIDGKLIYVLDMAWPLLLIALEYDGYAAHEGRQSYDAERDRRLERRGWIIVRACADDLKDPTRVLNQLTEAVARRSQ